MEGLDRAAVEFLALRLSLVLREHLETRPDSESSTFESLNAIACMLAPIFVGARDTGRENDCRRFFARALEEHVAALVSH